MGLGDGHVAESGHCCVLDAWENHGIVCVCLLQRPMFESPIIVFCDPRLLKLDQIFKVYKMSTRPPLPTRHANPHIPITCEFR